MYHGGSKYRTSPEFPLADHPHDADGSGIGLSVMRIDDGFVSLDSIGNRAGTLTTSPFTSRGTQFFLNMRAMLPESSVMVEVLALL